MDEDGTGYLHFGTFGTQLAIKMKKDATTGRTSYTEVETKADGTTPNLHTMKDADSNANGPKGFFEAAWVFRKGDTYYNVYDGGKPVRARPPAWNRTIKLASSTPLPTARSAHGSTKA